MADEWDRITINLDPEIGKKLRSRAKALRRSVSAHVARLVERDLGLAVEEEQSPYNARELDHDKPPDKTQRHRGDGPRRAVS